MAEYDVMRAIEELKEECAESQKYCECKWNGVECSECHYYIAIRALEKQIPKKPRYTGETNVYSGDVRVCNECGDKVCVSPMAKEYENYCRFCGKRLTDWSDADE